MGRATKRNAHAAGVRDQNVRGRDSEGTIGHLRVRSLATIPLPKESLYLSTVSFPRFRHEQGYKLFLSVASERGQGNQWQEKVPHDGVSPPRDDDNEYESSDTTPCLRGIFVLHPVEANLLATRSTRFFFPRPPRFNGLFCVDPSGIGPKPTLPYPNNAAMGFPPSVIGTGRDALTRSFAGLMPRAA